MEETISLKEIFDVIKKRFMLILMFVVGAALIAAIVSFFILTPIYQSSSQFIVNQSNQDTDEMQIDSGTIRTNVELINTYNVVITSRAILNDVIDKLDLSYSVDELADKIDVSSEEDSQVVTVTVKDPEPNKATDIANAVVGVFQTEIVELMNVDNVNILSEAVTKEDPSPVEPRPALNIAIALVLGGMVGVGIAFLLEYFDTSIKTEEDIEKKLGVPLIGVISTMEAEDIRQNPSLAMKKGGMNHVQAK